MIEEARVNSGGIDADPFIPGKLHIGSEVWEQRFQLISWQVSGTALPGYY